MLKNRALKIKVVSDKDEDGYDATVDYSAYTDRVDIAADAAIRVISEAGAVAVQAMGTYMVLDTVRKVCIAIASR